jgi:hypothetical protein
MICPFSVTLDNRAPAAPIRYPGFENIGPNLSGCTNCRPDLTHSVGPGWTGGRPDYWDPWFPADPLLRFAGTAVPLYDTPLPSLFMGVSHVSHGSSPTLR